MPATGQHAEKKNLLCFHLLTGRISVVYQFSNKGADQDFGLDFDRHPADIVGQPEYSIAILIIQALELHFRHHLDGIDGAKNGFPGFNAKDLDDHLMPFFIHKGRNNFLTLRIKLQCTGDKEGRKFIIGCSIHGKGCRWIIIFLIQHRMILLIVQG